MMQRAADESGAGLEAPWCKAHLRTEPPIEAKRLCKTFGSGDGSRIVLDRADVRVERGEFVAIVGPSGSGKSTLLNLLGCLDRPSSGTLAINGQQVDGLSPRDLARLRNRSLGFVFQSAHLMPKASALDNAALPLVYAGASRSDRRRRAAAVLDQLGLADRLHHLPSQLSGGQQQRVAIARALVTRPNIVFADEPTGALDSRASETVLETLRQIALDGMTVVMVTHDPAMAMAADRTISVHDGRVAGEQEIRHCD
jgi:putative ABC transport system ATP-binding protein